MIPNQLLPSMFGADVLEASQKHAEEEFPKESVGLVINNKYVPMKNIHSDPENHFKLHKSSVAAAAKEGEIQAVIHSHNITFDNDTKTSVHPPHPSFDDMECQIAWGIPFGIQLVNNLGAGNIIWWGDGVPRMPYEGRVYLHGVNDCYSILKDYYNQELKIKLPEFARHDYWWERKDSEGNNNLYLSNAIEQGFVQVKLSEIKPNDVILCTIRSEVPNHALIYLGGDEVLHHLTLNASRKESAARFLDPDLTLFHSVWRHKSLIEEPKPVVKAKKSRKKK